jgi:membrane fusion protein, multidrug efflux system
LSVLSANIDEAAAAVAQAQADLETARLNLSYAEICSPIDGYVGNRAAKVGAYVSQGAYLLTIVPAYGLWVDANFKEDQLARMKPGQPVTIAADTLPDHVLLSLAPATGAVFSVIIDSVPVFQRGARVEGPSRGGHPIFAIGGLWKSK